MHILLRIRDTDDEIRRWQRALAIALPEAHWHSESDIAPELMDQIRVAVVANPPAGALRGYPKLEFVQSLWAGVDSLLADNSVPEHLMIARMVDPAMAQAMAETALWATLSLHRGYFDYQQQQRDRIWCDLPQRRASDVRVTVLGLGAMGLTSAKRIASLGYAVSAWRTGHRHRDLADTAGIDVVSGTDALRHLLSKSGIVINLLPLTAQTRGLLNRDFFMAMPKGSSIVNLGRGGHLIEADLLSVLDAGHLHRAVLDVFQTEPLPADSAFWAHPKVTLLPHIAAITDPVSASQIVAKQIRSWAAGGPVAHQVQRGRGY